MADQSSPTRGCVRSGSLRPRRAVVEAGRQARADLESELSSRVGDDQMAAAKIALATLLELTGLDRHVPTRTVPLAE